MGHSSHDSLQHAADKSCRMPHTVIRDTEEPTPFLSSLLSLFLYLLLPLSVSSRCHNASDSTISTHCAQPIANHISILFYYRSHREREREMYLKDIDTRPRTHPLTRHNLGKSPARPAIVAAVGFLDEKKLLIVMAHPHTVPLPLGKHFDLTPSAPPFSLSCFLSFHLCLLFVVSACNTRILHNLLGIFNKKYHKANTERLKRELWSNGCQHEQGEREKEMVRGETLLAIPNGGRLANFTLR